VFVVDWQERYGKVRYSIKEKNYRSDRVVPLNS
jgi:hypothetical protein